MWFQSKASKWAEWAKMLSSGGWLSGLIAHRHLKRGFMKPPKATGAACHCAMNQKDKPIRKCSQNWFQENATGRLYVKKKHRFEKRIPWINPLNSELALPSSSNQKWLAAKNIPFDSLICRLLQHLYVLGIFSSHDDTKGCGQWSTFKIWIVMKHFAKPHWT